MKPAARTRLSRCKRRCWRSLRRVSGPEHPETLEGMTNLAGGYGRAGRLPEAIALQEQSLAIKRRVLPSNHPFFAAALASMANLYGKTGLSAEALGERANPHPR